MRMRKFLPLIATPLALAGNAAAGPEKFEQRGFIVNAAGERCAFQQNTISGALHFHGDAISTTIGEITFDDPTCMRGATEELQANKVAINQLLATWYSHPDADFDPENLYKTSLYQVVGQCMQSRRFAAIGIAIEYAISDESIAKVYHGPTLEGCLN